MIAQAAIVLTVLAGAPAMTEAEKSARARWFSFELTPEKVGGDWAAFVKAKEAEEARFADEAKKAQPSARYGPPPTVEQARARRVLQVEFREVAMKRTDEIRTKAKEVIEALRKGDVESLVDDCTMYDATAPDRRELTRKALTDARAELMRMAKLADTSAADFAALPHFTHPSPPTGMTGQLTIDFGPPAKAPKDKELYPERHQIELWWSGEVMPEANGPLQAAPAEKPPKSRWRFYRLIAPYSQRPMYLQ